MTAAHLLVEPQEVLELRIAPDERDIAGASAGSVGHGPIIAIAPERSGARAREGSTTRDLPEKEGPADSRESTGPGEPCPSAQPWSPPPTGSTEPVM